MKMWELFNLIKSIKHSEYTTSGDNVQWIIKVDDVNKVVMLIFEETADKRDWINNFNFPVKIYKKQESCLLAARGWGNAYRSCKDEVMYAMEVAIDIAKDYDFHICGWSYGGALSVLAAEDFYYRFHKKASVYTFGSPKPLWGKKAQRYVRSCINDIRQYNHINDCVTLLPPFVGYKRVVKNKIGKGFSLCKLFNPNVYHCIYDEEKLYKE